jgi:hypothetical protein
MSGFFHRLAARALGLTPILEPRARSRFEASGPAAWEEATVLDAAPARHASSARETDLGALAEAAAVPPAGLSPADSSPAAMVAATARSDPRSLPLPMTHALHEPPRAQRRYTAAIPARTVPSPTGAPSEASSRPAATAPIGQDAIRELTALIGRGETAAAPELANTLVDRRQAAAGHYSAVTPPPLPTIRAAAQDAVLPAQAAPANRRSDSPEATEAAVGMPPNAQALGQLQAAQPSMGVAQPTMPADVAINRVEIRFAAPLPAPTRPRASGPPPLADLLGSPRRSGTP